MVEHRDDTVDAAVNPSAARLRGGFAGTRPVTLFVGAAVAVIWDIIAFVHLFHFTFPGVSLGFWWPWALVLGAAIALGWTNRPGRSTPWWLWALLGIGIVAIAGATEATALSLWVALAIAAWPNEGRPWWIALGVLEAIHALAQWGLFMSWAHLSTSITMGILWGTGLGMLVSARGSNWQSA